MVGKLSSYQAFFLFTMVLLNSCGSQEIEDSIFSEISGKIIANSTADITNLLNITDTTYLLFYYKKSSQNSKLTAKILVEISQKLDFLFQTILIDCDSPYGVSVDPCFSNSTADTFPRIFAERPPELRTNPYTGEVNAYTEVRYLEPQMGSALLQNFITKNIPSGRVTNLSGDNIESFLNNVNYNKFILFTDKENVPLMYRGLANWFFDRAGFGVIHKSEKALIKRFNVTRFPTVIAYQTHEEYTHVDSPFIDYYSGEISSRGIGGFFDFYALPEKRYVSAKKGVKYEILKKFKPDDKFIDYFQKLNRRKVAVLFSVADDLSPAIAKFISMMNGYYFFIQLDCSGEYLEKCEQNFKVTSFPSLRVYQPGKVYEKRLESFFEHSLTREDLNSEIMNDLKNENIRSCNHETFQFEIVRAKKAGKLPLVHLYDQSEPNLPFFILSNKQEFQDVYEFINCENPAKKMLSDLKVKSLPQVFIVTPNDDPKLGAQVMHIQGELSYSNIFYFTNSHVLQRRSTSESEAVEDSVEKEELHLMELTRHFGLNCLNRNMKICALAMIDGRTHRSDLLRNFDKAIKTTENVIEKFKGKPYSFGWVNSTCHTEVNKLFGLSEDSLPNLVLYFPKQGVFSTLIGTYEEEALVKYVEDTLMGKTVLTKLEPSQIIFENKKCEEIKEEKPLEEEDEILKEIIEEERRKREEFEKEREATRKKPKKGKKKKKAKDDL